MTEFCVKHGGRKCEGKQPKGKIERKVQEQLVQMKVWTDKDAA